VDVLLPTVLNRDRKHIHKAIAKNYIWPSAK